MRVLLDTSVVLWAMLEPRRLTVKASALIADATTTVVVSAASAWEIGTKFRIGKLPIAGPLEADFVSAVRRSGYTLVSINAETALRAARLEADHRDPFDRLLAAQALAVDIPIISPDSKLDLFGVRRIW